MALSELSDTRSSSITLPLMNKSFQGVCPTLWPLGIFMAIALFMSGGTLIHAETVSLSSLTASPDATISGPGGLIYSHFTYGSNPRFPSGVIPPSRILVTIDSVSATQSRIQFGSFTAPDFSIITYQVTSTIAPITDFHLVTPAEVAIGPGRAFSDAGFLVSTDVAGIGSASIDSVIAHGGADRTLLMITSPFTAQPPAFPSGLATLSVRNGLQMSAPDSTIGGSPTFASLTLPHFDNVYTVAVVPEPSTWLLLASGLISLIFLRRSALKRQRGD